MKPKLPRLLLWQDKCCDEEFLDDPIGKRLFDLYVESVSGVNIIYPAFRIMNEVYYQCTKAVYENNLSPDIFEYEMDIKANLGLRMVASEVFKMMYALLSIRSNNSPAIESFKDSFDILSLVSKNKAFRKFISDTKKQGGKVFIDLSPKPYSAANLHKLSIYWPETTCGFDKEAIYTIVNLWERPADKLKVINLIENSFRRYKSGKDPLMFSFQRPKRVVVKLDLSDIKEEIENSRRGMASESLIRFDEAEKDNPILIENERLQQKVEEQQLEINRLKLEQGKPESERKQERSFSMKDILDYSVNSTTPEIGTGIIAMINRFLRNARDVKQEECDMVDEAENRILHPHLGDDIEGNKLQFQDRSSLFNLTLAKDVSINKVWNEIPEDARLLLIKLLTAKNNGR